MIRLLLGALLVVASGAAQTITPENPGVLLAPAASTELRVRVTDASGAVAAGVPITFVAPETGASGSFEGADPVSTVFTATTDAEGLAVAKFQANDTLGVFLVSAVLGRGRAETTFAVSVTTDAEPVLTAANARAAVIEQLAAGTRPVHGPLLLPAGSAVGPAWPGSIQYRSTRFTLDKPMWLLWVDEAAGAAYEHPVRFVLLDAGDDTPSVSTEGRVTREGWWPTVVLPYPRYVSLVPPASVNRQLGPLEPEPADVLRVAEIGLAVASNPDLCAITVHGPPDRGLRHDVAKMRRFLRDTVGVPEDQIFDTRDAEGNVRPLLNSDIDKLLQLVREKNCKKLYIHISAHGYNGGIAIGNEDDSDNYKMETGAAADGLNYKTIAEKLQPLAAQGLKVCFIIAACSSGSAIRELNNHGIMGEIITASGPAELAYFDNRSGYFVLDDFIKCFMDLQAKNGTNPTFTDVREWILANGGVDTKRATPQAAPIFPQAPPYTVPTVSIPDPSSPPVTLRLMRPAGAQGEVFIRVEILNPAIATFPQGEFTNVRIPAGQNEVTVMVRGLQTGVSPYTARATDSNLVEFVGRGRVEVGRIFVDPAPVSVILGQTAATNVARNGALSNSQPAGFRIVPKDAMSAGIARILPEVGAVPPGAPRLPLAVQGLSRGVATFRLEDPQTGALIQEFQVRVDGLSGESSTALMVGETRTVALTRSNPEAQVFAPVTITPVDPASGMIASVTRVVSLTPGQAEVPIMVTGLKVGTATFEVLDPNTGSRWRLVVVVSARVSCLPTGSHMVEVVMNPIRDPERHDRVFNLRRLGLNVLVEPGPNGANVKINTSNPLIGNLQGMMYANCMVDATGTGRFNNSLITNAFHGQLLAGGVTGNLSLGAYGGLPGMGNFGIDAVIEEFSPRLNSRMRTLFESDSSTARLRPWNQKILAAGASGRGSAPPGFPFFSQGPDAIDSKILCIEEEVVAPKPASMAQLPVRFEPNRGQADRGIQFLARQAGLGVYFRPGEVAFSTPERSVRMRFEGASRRGAWRGMEQTAGHSTYLTGSKPGRWKGQAPHFRKVAYRNAYDGVDLVFYGAGRSIEYDVIVSRGADPKRVVMQFDGVDSITADGEGNVRLAIRDRWLTLRKPAVFQQDGKPVDATYIIERGNRLRFEVEAYDREQELLIDPVVEFTAYLGGAGTDIAQDVAADEAGNVYVAGYTSSANFPVRPGAAQSTSGGGFDAFVSKFAAGTHELMYSTYVGGSGADQARAMALGPDGSVYIAGTTSSTNFPVTQGSLQSTYGGGTGDAFLSRLKPDGSGFVYSTFLGGSSTDLGVRLQVDSTGAAYVAGHTFSSNFRTTAGVFQPTYRGGLACGPSAARTACDDVFLAKLNPAGTALVYSTFLGGTNREQPWGLEIDAAGNALVAGATRSSDFPPTPGSYQTNRKETVCGTGANAQPCQDAFLTSVNPTATALNFSTYLGGDGDDVAIGLATDFAGTAYLTGSTSSINFPVTAGALQRSYGGGPNDIFVSAIDAYGRSLLASTYLGGAGSDIGESIAITKSGRIYVAADTASSNYPERPAGGAGVPVTYEVRDTR